MAHTYKLCSILLSYVPLDLICTPVNERSPSPSDAQTAHTNQHVCTYVNQNQQNIHQTEKQATPKTNLPGPHEQGPREANDLRVVHRRARGAHTHHVIPSITLPRAHLALAEREVGAKLLHRVQQPEREGADGRGHLYDLQHAPQVSVHEPVERVEVGAHGAGEENRVLRRTRSARSARPRTKPHFHQFTYSYESLQIKPNQYMSRARVRFQHTRRPRRARARLRNNAQAGAQALEPEARDVGAVHMHAALLRLRATATVGAEEMHYPD